MRLRIAQHRPARVRVVGGDDAGRKGVRRCSLAWRVIEVFSRGAASLVEVDLGTGFLHQIRVMMAELGHPLLGDAVYGEPATDPVEVPRQMLHARALRLGPAYGVVEPPGDFRRVVAALRGEDLTTVEHG